MLKVHYLKMIHRNCRCCHITKYEMQSQHAERAMAGHSAVL